MREHRWRRRLGIVALVAAVAASAWGIWTYVVPHRADIPALAGETVAAAQAQLSEQGFAVRIADGQYSETMPADHVLRTQPSAGTSLEKGETVTLVPSLGPPPVKIPQIEGKPLERARLLLQKAGLTLGNQTRKYSDTVPEGSVIAAVQTGQVPKGSPVDVTVSRGPAPLPITSVSGMGEGDATAALQADGFSVTVDTEFSNSVDRGFVIGVDPRAGTVAPYGSSVTLIVSQGPERFPVPSFSGLSKSAAQAKADDYGLEVSFFSIPNTQGATVISQSPGVGSTVTYGDAVTLYLA